MTADGSPFFFLADTAWNAALRGDTEEWQRYCATRAAQGFTVIQFVASLWRGCSTPRHGRLFEERDGEVVFDEQAWAKMREFLSVVTEHGLVPAPVMVWRNNPDEPLYRFSEETCIRAGRRMVEEWSGYDPLWILGGDGDYRGRSEDAYWKTIGRGIFADHPDALVTMHPCGATWICDNFRDEPWYTFAGIQSGHGSSENDLRFLLSGPYTTRWRELGMPLINLECNYEHAKSYHEDLFYTAYHVRRGTWWSLLGAPTAGITYGSNTIWIWPTTDHELAEGHGTGWPADHWSAGLETDGIRSMQVCRTILDRLPWHELRPAPHVLDGQPGLSDPTRFCAAAATPDMSTVLVYVPRQVAPLEVSAVQITDDHRATWVNPRTAGESEGALRLENDRYRVQPPSHEDWLLHLHREA